MADNIHINYSFPTDGWFHEPTPDHAGDDDSFDIGDIVNLTVGGPDMVVISTCECGAVEVAWIKVDGDVMADSFPTEVLVHA